MRDGADSGATTGEMLRSFLSGVLAPESLQALTVILGALGGKEPSALDASEADLCIGRVRLALRVYCTNSSLAETTLRRVTNALRHRPSPESAASNNDEAEAPPPSASVRGMQAAQAAALAAIPSDVSDLSIPIITIDDVVRARMTAKSLAEKLGFGESVSMRIATSVSEVARNILLYAGKGRVELQPCPRPGTTKRGLQVVAEDHGPGIDDVDLVLSGQFHSKQGLGLGLRGIKRMMDVFEISTEAGKGTTVLFAEWF